MTVRVALRFERSDAGREFDEYQNLTRLLPMGFGDDMLRFNGIGERITVRHEQQRQTQPDRTKIAITKSSSGLRNAAWL